jgi:hypothetical protein
MVRYTKNEVNRGGESIDRNSKSSHVIIAFREQFGRIWIPRFAFSPALVGIWLLLCFLLFNLRKRRGSPNTISLYNASTDSRGAISAITASSEANENPRRKQLNRRKPPSSVVGFRPKARDATTQNLHQYHLSYKKDGRGKYRNDANADPKAKERESRFNDEDGNVANSKARTPLAMDFHIVSEAERVNRRRKHEIMFKETFRQGEGVPYAYAPPSSQVLSGNATQTSTVLRKYSGSYLSDGTGILRGQNVTRLSFVVYKLIRLFGLKSMVDFPSRCHKEWMPELVERLEFDQPSFRYYGMDHNMTYVAEASREAQRDGRAAYILADVEFELPVKSELLLHWAELDGGRRDPGAPTYARYMLHVIQVAKRAGISYVMFAQYPRIRGMLPVEVKGVWTFVGNEEESPFLFNERICGAVSMGRRMEHGRTLFSTVLCMRGWDVES